MAADPDGLFRFWAELPADAFQHPRDQDVLARVPHGFPHSAPPNPFFGPLKTAPVVLLYLSPGLGPFDEQAAADPGLAAFFRSQRTGDAPLPSREEYPPWWDWWSARVAQFGADPAAVREKVGFLNISPYRSRTFNDWPMLAALPSARAALDWAQGVLFPQAIEGRRTVICLRSARYWGLFQRPDGEPWGEALFVPRFTQGGFLFRDDARERVGQAVRRRLAAARPA